jgi:hypothetical protein
VPGRGVEPHLRPSGPPSAFTARPFGSFSGPSKLDVSSASLGALKLCSPSTEKLK